MYSLISGRQMGQYYIFEKEENEQVEKLRSNFQQKKL